MKTFEKFYWAGCEDMAAVYRANGDVLCTVCKRDKDDESATIRATQIVYAQNSSIEVHYQAGQIKKLERERDEAQSRADIAEQNNKWLDKQNAKLRMEQGSKVEGFRDIVALGASLNDIQRFREPYPNPAGGPKVFYRYTKEQARYRYADAILAARAETTEKP